MTFLHGLRPPRIHQDLKSSNLLVSFDWTVRVSDFGLPLAVPREGINLPSVSRREHGDERSTLLKPLPYITVRVGNPAWAAPEVYGNKPYGSAADVYSFGIVLWEIVARKLPFGDMIFLEEIKDAVITGERLEIPENCPSELTDLIKSCWHGLPACRPKFAEVVSRLVGMGADRSSQFDPTRATELDVETETFENVARTECCRRSFEVVTSR
ncbi:dual specificity protein kinase shkC-like [Corticium candelabrum]|uniref:dual specificity protein kinase shkC-like n=1 Tax=Corticium candelabrum TaxID=121492 RepID=UPI002E26B7D7|nr:dual specificity protein kinase shkC-like [Corticium candelabrum]